MPVISRAQSCWSRQKRTFLVGIKDFPESGLETVSARNDLPTTLRSFYSEAPSFPCCLLWGLGPHTELLSLMPLKARCVFCHPKQKWNMQGSCFLSAVLQIEVSLVVNLEATEGPCLTETWGVTAHAHAFFDLACNCTVYFSNDLATQIQPWAFASVIGISSRLAAWEKIGLK